MNVKEIQEIVNSPILPTQTKESLIINSLAEDKNVATDIIKILSREREVNQGLISDMNLELSRAHTYIDRRSELKPESKENFNKSFVLDKIAAFYIKHKGLVTHCFNRFK